MPIFRCVAVGRRTAVKISQPHDTSGYSNFLLSYFACPKEVSALLGLYNNGSV